VKLRRRRLPHLDVAGRPLFITFRLHNSLPAQRPSPASNPTSGEAFVTMDRLLDHARFARSRSLCSITLALLDHAGFARSRSLRPNLLR
jgi:hypothetical protein